MIGCWVVLSNDGIAKVGLRYDGISWVWGLAEHLLSWARLVLDGLGWAELGYD